MAHRLTLPVLRPGLLCLADLAKQVIFLCLKLAVAGLQGLGAICGGLLLPLMPHCSLRRRPVVDAGFPPVAFDMRCKLAACSAEYDAAFSES